MMKIFPTVRVIHRIFALLVLIFFLLMGTTGMAMKYYPALNWLMAEPLARHIHNTLSPFFAIILGVQALTGAYFLLYPLFRSRTNIN